MIVGNHVIAFSLRVKLGQIQATATDVYIL